MKHTNDEIYQGRNTEITVDTLLGLMYGNSLKHDLY